MHSDDSPTRRLSKSGNCQIEPSSMSPKIDIRVPVGLPVKETALFIKECEAAGFDGVGVHDHQHSGRDVYLTLALAALQTSSLNLYPATSNPVTRHQMVLASLTHTLEEIAPGRIRLSLAPGFLSVGNIGQPRARIAQMREAIVNIKSLLSGDTVKYGNTAGYLRNTSPTPTPVFITAAGPKMLELAGEVADGVMAMVGLDPRIVRAAKEHLKIGAARSGRNIDDIPIIFITHMAVDENQEEAQSWPKRYLAPQKPWLSYPSKSHHYWLRKIGIDLPDSIDPSTIPTKLSHQICDALGLFGTPEYCAERLQQAVTETSIDHIFLFPVHTIDGGYIMPTKELETCKNFIFPKLFS